MSFDESHYFCTVGFGLEKFTEKELLGIGAEIAEVLVGKTFFMSSAAPEKLLRLKTIERLFVSILHQTSDLAGTGNAEELYSRLLDSCDFAKKLETSINVWTNFVSLGTEGNLKFRVNARCSGKFRKLLPPHIVSQITGSHIAKLTNFQVDFQTFDFELFVHLNDSYFTAGIPVTKRPLSDRGYLRHIAVRSTVCCVLCMLVDLKAEDVLLDPMCGAATILIEGVKQFGVKTAVGVDIDETQLQKAAENLSSSFSSVSPVTLIKADFTKEIFRSELFDVVICDVPFGRKFCKKTDVRQLLSEILKQTNICLKRGGRCAILISEELKNFLVEESLKYWKLVTENKLRLGVLSAVILSFIKI